MFTRFVLNVLPNGVSQQLTKFYFRVLCRNQRGTHSIPQSNKYKSMIIKTLPVLQDNYMYLIVDKATNEAAVIDPVEPTIVMNAVRELNCTLTTVLTTHHHWDHSGGNCALLASCPNRLQVYGGDYRIPALTHFVEHNHQFNVGTLQIKCLATPCHTAGHICYYVTATGPPGKEQDPVVFTGDTLFVGGCGRFFEGTAEQMYDALVKKLSNLPEETKVFCGHEYTVSNLQFATFVEPSNVDACNKLAWSCEQRQQNYPTVPSTIGDEKAYNPFMRVTESEVMCHAMKTDPIETMKYIRNEKDTFQVQG